MQINEVAEVIPGYTFRGAIVPDSAGHTYVFQAKNVSLEQDFSRASDLVKVSQNIPEYAGHLRKNDILLVARGMKSGAFRATVFMVEDENVVASGSIHILRVTSDTVLPDYLAHYLNSKSGQDSLAEIVSGSYIGAISRKELERLEVPIPPLQKQRAIVNLQKNIREQQRLIERKSFLNQNISNAVFKNLTTA